MMNYATEMMSLEDLRLRLEAAYDRQDAEDVMACSRLIDRLTVIHLQQAARA